MSLRLKSIPDDIKAHVRENFCCDCEGQTRNNDCDSYGFCDGFSDECERVMEVEG